MTDGPFASDVESSGTFRDPTRDCDFCGASEGSVIVQRETDKARCNDCFNDPSTYDE